MRWHLFFVYSALLVVPFMCLCSNFGYFCILFHQLRKCRVKMCVLIWHCNYCGSLFQFIPQHKKLFVREKKKLPHCAKSISWKINWKWGESMSMRLQHLLRPKYPSNMGLYSPSVGCENPIDSSQCEREKKEHRNRKWQNQIEIKPTQSVNWTAWIKCESFVIGRN